MDKRANHFASNFFGSTPDTDPCWIMNTSMETLALLELYLPEYIRTITYVPWVFSLLGAALIGLSGILPLIIIPSEEAGKDKEIKNREYQAMVQVLTVISAVIKSRGFLYRSFTRVESNNCAVLLQCMMTSDSATNSTRRRS